MTSFWSEQKQLLLQAFHPKGHCQQIQGWAFRSNKGVCRPLNIIFPLSFLTGRPAPARQGSPFALLADGRPGDQGNPVGEADLLGWRSPGCCCISCCLVTPQPGIWEITFISPQVTFKPRLGKDTSNASWANVRGKDKWHTLDFQGCLSRDKPTVQWLN